MIEDLKTLKDLREEHKQFCPIEHGFSLCPFCTALDKAEDEAVKWVKKLKKEYWSAEQFCEYFFNLTEEEEMGNEV